jgi:hypothetical protein
MKDDGGSRTVFKYLFSFIRITVLIKSSTETKFSSCNGKRKLLQNISDREEKNRMENWYGNRRSWYRNRRQGERTDQIIPLYQVELLESVEGWEWGGDTGRSSSENLKIFQQLLMGGFPTEKLFSNEFKMRDEPNYEWLCRCRRDAVALVFPDANRKPSRQREEAVDELLKEPFFQEAALKLLEIEMKKRAVPTIVPPTSEKEDDDGVGMPNNNEALASVKADRDLLSDLVLHFGPVPQHWP